MIFREGRSFLKTKSSEESRSSKFEGAFNQIIPRIGFNFVKALTLHNRYALVDKLTFSRTQPLNFDYEVLSLVVVQSLSRV